VLFDLVAFNGSSGLDSAAEKKELLGECRFTRVGVGYDGKRPAFVNLVTKF
jgi:hypothetical protein